MHHLRPHQHDFARSTAIEELIGLNDLVEGEAVSDQGLSGMRGSTTKFATSAGPFRLMKIQEP